MGVFDVFCAESSLVLRGDTRLILLAEDSNGQFEPVALPIRGNYNRYGSIDTEDESLDENSLAAFAFLKTLKYDVNPVGSGFEDHLAVLNYGASEGGWGRWNGRCLSMALIHGGIYAAIVRTVASAGKPEWVRYSSGLLEKQSVESLVDQVFPAGEVTRAIYQADFESLKGALLSSLLDFVRFRAWGTRLKPLDISKSEQFTGFRKDQNIGPAPEEYLAAARKKYAAYSILLAALEDDQRCWLELS